jgi:hypothetical protein
MCADIFQQISQKTITVSVRFNNDTTLTALESSIFPLFNRHGYRAACYNLSGQFNVHLVIIKSRISLKKKPVQCSGNVYLCQLQYETLAMLQVMWFIAIRHTMAHLTVITCRFYRG